MCRRWRADLSWSKCHISLLCVTESVRFRSCEVKMERRGDHMFRQPVTCAKMYRTLSRLLLEVTSW